MARRATDAGILAMECYFPQRYVPQTALEEADGCAGKYTVGLGQTALAFFDDREDIASVLLTACARLLERYGVPASAIGRLEVGTETLLDKSKSVKTTLMAQLFGAEHSDVEGVSSTNACYGGTAALLNSVAWVESSAWDGRYALVVCGDIAVYAPGPARPTGGGGAVAMLVGPDAPLVMAGPRATHAFEVYDFYKPRGDTEYATVDGKLSQDAYLASVDTCWSRLKQLGLNGSPADLRAFDYVCMHSPYNKLVQKGFARLLYGTAALGQPSATSVLTLSRRAAVGDFADDATAPRFAGDAQRWAGVPPAKTVGDREAEKCFVGLAKPDFEAKCAPSDTASRQVGNCYTAALYMNLLSLVSAKASSLIGARLLLFSYGSGAVATAFTLIGREPSGGSALALPPASPFTLERIATTAQLAERLTARTCSDLPTLTRALELREERYGQAGYEPSGDVGALAPGTYYLAAVDELHRRTYSRK
ncbi:hydroxymethylglutaryl-CoA synthase [Emiliania huxleyi CCMP1516]|uniref:Hydroxymethylglutaryl-CoA synthase n=2 Tax=Emiliania huxleyi TaxID=2903 RepID=A0A0D3KBR2_EMIH1|nr:hydroxymethylglutaryl-CoA synthase [Emiliania huxleyi CCMP1516]EOD33197.1 hydroxymethylglutaryl-CoA synthase [Emiliania huxleyi CCMP1516]|eukprot:XP_005785626.1 hydroxymethylglutaryl-CoA synthase [Emiliania huxleyi CCMP1516]